MPAKFPNDFDEIVRAEFSADEELSTELRVVAATPGAHYWRAGILSCDYAGIPVEASPQLKPGYALGRFRRPGKPFNFHNPL